MKGKKGQRGVIGAVFALIMFVILWALWLGSWINTVSNDMITNNGLVGFEAFLVSQLNLWIWLGILIGFLAIVYLGGEL